MNEGKIKRLVAISKEEDGKSLIYVVIDRTESFVLSVKRIVFFGKDNS